MNRLLELVLRRESVLVVFVVTAVAKTLFTEFAAAGEGRLLSILSLIIFPVLAWFAHKGFLLATWCTILLLIMTGSGLLFDAFNALQANGEGYPLLLFKCVVGIYLTWGALVLHRKRHARD